MVSEFLDVLFKIQKCTFAAHFIQFLTHFDPNLSLFHSFIVIKEKKSLTLSRNKY